jgi:hypothetical protein
MAPTPTLADVTLTPISATAMLISVVPPPNPTVGNTSLDVQRYDGGFWRNVGTFSNLYLRTDTGLTASTAYGYRVRFKDLSGWNTTPYSPTKTATTLATGSTGPSNFLVQGQTTSSITWTWDATPEATSYELHDAVGALKATLAAGVLSYPESALLENTEYPRRLYFRSADGLSAPSGLLSGSTAVHAATTADFSLQPVSATQMDVIVFSPPGAADGQTGVEIQRSPNGSTWTTLQPFSAVYSASDLGVTAGQTWSYRIQFRNRLGIVSGYSPAKSATVGAPPAPGSFAGSAQSTSSILWSWANVDGESGFQLHDAAEALRGSAGPGMLSLVESGLAENIQFTRHVHSVNGLGISPASVDGLVYTLIHDPLPAEISLNAVSTTQVNITVTPPPNNGTNPLTGCEIQRSPNGSSWTTIKPFSSATTFNDIGLTALATYTYRFRYQNGDGVPTLYATSAPTVLVPRPVITTPSKTIRTQTIAVAGTTVAGVSSVHVYFNGTDKGTATLTGTNWTLSSTGNAANTYTITAKAFISTTASDASPSISIVVDLTAPAAPTNIRTTAYSNAIDVEWDASTSPDVVGYRVYRKTGTGGTFTLLNTTGEVSGTKYRDSTAVNGTTYFYHVTAVDNALPN